MSNTTTIYVTHDYQECIGARGTVFPVMREGTLVQIGTPEEILAQAR